MCKMIIKVDMEINDLWNYLRIVTLGVLVLYMLGSAHIDCFSVLLTYIVAAEEAKKKKDKKEKDSEKPDTFLEKLIVHLTKNMQVSSSERNSIFQLSNGTIGNH